MEKTDITIIGAGVIGLSVAHELSALGKDVLVIEKNLSFGQETSSRNSEVIHSGIYYPRDTLKSKTCLLGKEYLYKLCADNNIAHKRMGKLVIATNKEEEVKLEVIYKNAGDCGITDIRYLDNKEIARYEPDLKVCASLMVEDSGILDTHRFMTYMYEYAKSRNVEYAFSVEVIGIERKGVEFVITVKEPSGETYSFESRIVLNCAGLLSDAIAEMAGIDSERRGYKLCYCKGQYFRINKPGKFSINHLIYPPPTGISLGIHITPDLGNGLRLGPDAQFVDTIDYKVNEEDRNAFYEAVKVFLPSIELDDLIPDTAGIRPKFKVNRDGFNDFIIRSEEESGHENFINTIGIESPGFTASIAIGKMVKDMVEKRI